MCPRANLILRSNNINSPLSIKSHHKRHRHRRQEQPFIDPLYSYVFLLFLHFPPFSSHSLSAPILIYPEHNKYIVHPFGIDFGPFLRFSPALIKRSVIPSSLPSPKLVHRPVPSIVLQNTQFLTNCTTPSAHHPSRSLHTRGPQIMHHTPKDKER
jgi:hypothetical protein